MAGREGSGFFGDGLGGRFFICVGWDWIANAVVEGGGRGEGQGFGEVGKGSSVELGMLSKLGGCKMAGSFFHCRMEI